MNNINIVKGVINVFGNEDELFIRHFSFLYDW